MVELQKLKLDRLKIEYKMLFVPPEQPLKKESSSEVDVLFSMPEEFSTNLKVTMLSKI